MSLQKAKRAVEKDAPIIEEGTSSSELFYLMKGTAIAEVKGRTVGTIQSGEWFGELAAILGATRTATVRAVTPCEVIVFKGLNDKALLDAVQKDPKVIQKLVETLAMRLVESSRRNVNTSESSEGILERFEKAISGTIYALDKIMEKYPNSKPLREVKEHLSGTSGVAEGSRENMNPDFFRATKEIVTG